MGNGALPQTPRFNELVSKEAMKKKAVPIDHCLSQTRYSARVAPQRCTILCIGKASLLYHNFDKIIFNFINLSTLLGTHHIRLGF